MSDDDKLHLFLDETGQHSQGEYFILAVVVIGKGRLQAARQEIEALEQKTNRRGAKWSKTNGNEALLRLADAHAGYQGDKHRMKRYAHGWTDLDCHLVEI
ncbi:MAG: hypothetical protein AB7S38_00500 [Vulcanimicrobiota bacterium]